MLQEFTTGHLIAFIYGSLIGSFSNVCIHRLPRRQSLAFPASHCPTCQEQLRPWHNIPFVSYLALGGRCAFCRTAISIRYPLVELLCGLLYVFLYAQFGFSVHSVIMIGLVTALLVASFIDLQYKIIPDSITLPGIIIGLFCSSFLTPVGFVNALLGVVIGGGLFFLVAVVSGGGMGGGDIKLIAMIGAFLGWQAALMTIFFAAFTGAVVGVALMIVKKKGRKDMVPFGPFLALGAVLAMVWGSNLLHWYLSA